MDASLGQIRFLHGNRLEALADALAQDLGEAGQLAPLEPELIAVPHPAMARWLERHLARRWGIAMALEFPLPARLARRLLEAALGRGLDPDAYGYDALIWRLMATLPEFVESRDGAALRAAWRPELPLSVYALARQLALLFDAYLVHRPEWLLHWEAGRSARTGSSDELWQAALWRTLVGREETAVHRAALLDAAMRSLRTGAPDRERLPRRISVFGVATLPLATLSLIGAAAAHVPVRWYYPNPSDLYWWDLHSERELATAARRSRARGLAADATALHSEHALLAAWGRAARRFLEARDAATSTAIDDEFACDASRAPGVLGWLQRGMLHVDPAAESPPALHSDRSLSVHCCTSRLRELEIVRDRILAHIDADPTLTPDQIVVMVPDIARYAVLARAVFAQGVVLLPYQVTEAPSAGSADLISKLFELIELPDARFSLGEVLDRLAHKAFGARFGLDPDAVRWLREATSAAGITWGIDAPHRSALRGGEYAQGTWRQGLDRLLLGYALGDEDDVVAGVAPLALAEGERAQWLGGLEACIERAARWRERLIAARDCTSWSQSVRELWFDFVADDADPEVASTLAQARTLLQDWCRDVIAAGAGRLPLDRSVMLESLRTRAREITGSGLPAGSGVTLCAMVPMRSVPYRVVCLLGLDEASFPRRDSERDWNLMRAQPLGGDRLLRDDDRLLMLEALASARTHLHLSYVGIEASEGAERPPSTLIEELLAFIAQHAGAEPAAVRAALTTVHPAEPWNPAQFDAEAPTSYAAEWLPAARAVQGERRPAAPLRMATAPNAAAPISIDALRSFCRDPARFIVRRLWQLRAPALAVAESEDVLVGDSLSRYGLRAALLELRREGIERAAVAETYARARNLLVPGPIGESEFAATWADSISLAASAPARVANFDPRPLRIALGEFVLEGRVTRDLAEGGAVYAGALNGGHRLDAALAQHLAARLGIGGGNYRLVGWNHGVEQVDFVAGALPSVWYEHLLRCFLAASQSPPALWRKASWAFAEAVASGKSEDDALRKARDAFEGGRFRGALPGEGAEFEAATLARALGGEAFGSRFVAIASELLLPLAQAEAK
jgi:exodeoxyribonuclease V gamma subunit